MYIYTVSDMDTGLSRNLVTVALVEEVGLPLRIKNDLTVTSSVVMVFFSFLLPHPDLGLCIFSPVLSKCTFKYECMPLSRRIHQDSGIN